jgi:hypothetical protein
MERRKIGGSINRGSVCPKRKVKHGMPVGFSLADSFLQNGLERLVYDLYLSICLGVLRGIMDMFKPHFRC